METNGSDLALHFEPEGYVLNGPKLMGRQAAGNGFLRAAVAGRDGGTLWAYTPSLASGQVFAKEVEKLDPAAKARWCPGDRLDLLEAAGTLYLPGPDIGSASKVRLRQGIAAYSICGITHTTASHRAMDALSSISDLPVMPWDALICTSSAVAETVRIHQEAQAEYLRWRFGAHLAPPAPQLPVIPLGIHTSDYALIEERLSARTSLGIKDDEVVVLYVGRLSYHAKAHPDVMYLAMQAVSAASGAKLTLIQCGWFANDQIEEGFRTGLDAAAPDVRGIFTDGRVEELRRQSWAAADIFISLSDNIQETFGLTPIEAMAAGLPVLVTDWDGYKDTIRDGVDGFKIPTWMPPPGCGVELALAYETGVHSYDRYCAGASQGVAVDLDQLVRKLGLLVDSGDLRRSMGAAARSRALTLYDWSVVYTQYRELWRELRRIRERAKSSSAWDRIMATAPKAAPSRLDPMLSFAHYPSHTISSATVLAAAGRPDGREHSELLGHAFYSYTRMGGASEQLASSILERAKTPKSVQQISQDLGFPVEKLIPMVGQLAKMQLIRLSAASTNVAG